MLLFHHSLAVCNIHGECTESLLLYSTQTYDYSECLGVCQNTTNCAWFSFHTNTLACTAFANCVELDQKCEFCVSGEVNCPDLEPACGVPGLCLGPVIESRREDNAGECLRYCNTDNNCAWASFDNKIKTCYLFENCPDLQTSCLSCISGERRCAESPCKWSKKIIARKNMNLITSYQAQ